jgi:hypothetical protein
MLLYSYNLISGANNKKRIIIQAIEGFVEEESFNSLYNITISHVRCFKFLLDLGFISNDTLNEIFIYSARSGNRHFVDTILKYNPDINADNGQALFAACYSSNIEVVKLLFDLGVTRNTIPNVLTLRTVRKNTELFKLCVESGVEITADVRNLVYGTEFTDLYQFVGPEPKDDGVCNIS